jgi:hypothetical protein
MEYDDSYDNNMVSESSRPQNTVKILNVMDILSTEDVIRRICLNMAGLQVKNVKGLNKFIRFNKPDFSDEFIAYVQSELLIHSNQVTSYSVLDEEHITNYVRTKMLALTDYFYTVGRDNFISNYSWDKIKSIHREKATEIITTDKDGKRVQKTVSGWHHILGYDWSPNELVSSQMLNFVRDTKKDQQNDNFRVIAKNYLLEIYNFIKSALMMSRETAEGMGNMQSHSQNTQTIRQANLQVPVGRKSLLENATRMYGTGRYR